MAELFGDRLHFRMPARSAAIGLELPLQIARIERGQPRRAGAVAKPVETMTGDAGVRRAGIAPAQCDQMTAFGEAIGGCGLGRAAPSDARRKQERKQRSDEMGAPIHDGVGTGAAPRWFRRRNTACWLGADAGGNLSTAHPSLLLILLIAACKPPPDERHHMPEASVARGKEMIGKAGCGACHTIPGIPWPQGSLGPSLQGFAGQTLIAGRLPNRPDLLAAFIRNAPALVPGTTMPAMPLSEGESRDVAAYLYTLQPR